MHVNCVDLLVCEVWRLSLLWFVMKIILPKHRWEDDVKSDVANMRITNWKDRIRNRPKWKEFVEKAKTSLKF